MPKSYDVSVAKKFDDPPKVDVDPNSNSASTDDGLIESDRGNWGNPVNYFLSN